MNCEQTERETHLVGVGMGGKEDILFFKSTIALQN